MDAVDAIVRTCLYEGYLLWPYRRSALKNTKRWTFGAVFPRGCADELGEPSVLQTQVLLDAGAGAGTGTGTEVIVRLRFLQVVDRAVVREGAGGPENVDELVVNGERYLAWQEATERELAVPVPLPLDGPLRSPLRIPADTEREELTGADGRLAGSLIRSWQQLEGTLEVATEPVGDGGLRLTVRVENCTPCAAAVLGARHARDAAAEFAFVSTHLVLHSDGAPFVSLLDPPERLRAAAGGCDNRGCWPVLAGEPAVREGQDGQDARAGAAGAVARTVLASPVVLYDFPAVAPESPGDLFDGTEIDQLLVLSILSMTEEEQAEARATDPRAREILDRCAGLGPEELAALHGAVRGVRPLQDAS